MSIVPMLQFDLLHMFYIVRTASRFQSCSFHWTDQDDTWTLGLPLWVYPILDNPAQENFQKNPSSICAICMKICFTLSSSHFKWRQSMCLLFKYPCIPPILKFTLFFCASKEAGLAQEFRETFYKQLLLAISVAYCHWASITNANGTAQSQCRTYAPQVPRTLSRHSTAGA